VGWRRLNARLAAYTAWVHGVTVEHLRATVRVRRDFRRAVRWRTPRRNGHRVKTTHVVTRRWDPSMLLAGEGELHGLLKTVGLKPAEFCALVGIERTVFLRWYGHPLHPWPTEFLRYYARAQAMGRYLESQGVDLEQFEPKLPPAKARPAAPPSR
jgi:hypothetical protein